MINIKKAIQEMYNLKNKGVRYSMTGKRDGSDGTADCSGAIYHSLRVAGASNAGWVLNTDSLHSWLEKNGFKLIAHNSNWNAKRGDITIFGVRGGSAGSAGHVILWISNTHFIHCTWKTPSRNGVFVDNESYAPYAMQWYTYRLTGGSGKQSSSKQSSNTSSYYGKFHNENGNFKITVSDGIALRTQPSTSKGKRIAYLPKGSVIKYDAFLVDMNGYVWIRQKRSNWYAYMATGKTKNGKRVSGADGNWGVFY